MGVPQPPPLRAGARGVRAGACAAGLSSGSASEGLAAAALYVDDLDTPRNGFAPAYRGYLDQNDVSRAGRAVMQTATYHEAHRRESAIEGFERADSLLDTICPAAFTTAALSKHA